MQTQMATKTQLFISEDLKFQDKCIGKCKENIACLKTPKATSPWETDVADVRGVIGWDHLIDDKSPVPQVSTS